MKLLISNETKFKKKLTENPTKSREQSLICYLRQLKRDQLIADYMHLFKGPTQWFHTWSSLWSTKGSQNWVSLSSNCLFHDHLQQPPRLLPCKRPATSKNCFSVKYSFRFAEWAKQYTHNGEFMCSFDERSLFTNVSLNKTIEIYVLILSRKVKNAFTVVKILRKISSNLDVLMSCFI